MLFFYFSNFILGIITLVKQYFKKKQAYLIKKIIIQYIFILENKKLLQF